MANLTVLDCVVSGSLCALKGRRMISENEILLAD